VCVSKISLSKIHFNCTYMCQVRWGIEVFLTHVADIMSLFMLLKVHVVMMKSTAMTAPFTDHCAFGLSAMCFQIIPRGVPLLADRAYVMLRPFVYIEFFL
jgi:hypothetical protein